MWEFINTNANGIMAVTAVLALLGSVFGFYYRGKFKAARKSADNAYISIEDLKSEVSSLSKRLGDAKNDLNRCSPDHFLERIAIFKDSASLEDLQNAATEYFSHQNQAITTAAGFLAEKALLLEAKDGPAALHEAKRWLTLGLAATPRNQHQNEMMAEINDRLNALELGLTGAVKIDDNMNLAAATKCADSLMKSAQFKLAEVYAHKSVEIAKRDFGKDHPGYANSLRGLGALKRMTGQYSEAESLLTSALEIAQKALGNKHPQTAQYLNSLAVMLGTAGRHDEAEPLYRQALEIRRSALGEDHPDYANSLTNLAALLVKTGRSDEAEPLSRQALEIHRSALGEDHPDFAHSLDNLAALLGTAGEFGEAEQLYRQALEIRRNALGEDHPDFAHILNSLARLLNFSGRPDEAEKLYRQAAMVFEKSLGPEHPHTINVIQNLENLLASQP